MKNRFTSVIVITTAVLSLSLLAFASPKPVAEKKAMCTPEMMKKCMKDHCPPTSTCPFVGDKAGCCDGE